MRHLVALLAVLAAAPAAVAAGSDAGHPFLLWTKDEAAAIRKRIETDPLAKKQYEKMVALETGKLKIGTRGAKTNGAMLNLFKYAVMGDREAGEREKKALLKFIGARVPTPTPGNPATGNVHRRDDRTLDALRYDVLYDLLSDEERRGVEDTIRYYVHYVKTEPWPYLGRPRTGWLPNMQWPTMAGVHVLAVASRDEGLIRDVFNSPGGWKWFFDEYVADGTFYMEEFGKYYSNIGAMLLWCEGLDRLGLGRYGWGYTGTGGATMRKFLGMKIRAGLPRTENPGGMPSYEIVTMGDAGTSPIVHGYDAAGVGGNPWWSQSLMNGPIPKMRDALWFEVGARRWPDDGFDYFLAQMRAPGEDVYLPSLYFGLTPVDPKQVKAPPAPSLVTRERGFALLRAEESPAYWESPAPAVALQFGMYYVHYVHDCFSILDFVAENRSLYNRMGSVGRGYAGGDPWRDHVNGQASGVVVDGQKAQPADTGEEGTKNERVREHFSPAAKFVAVRASGIYPGVDQERALVLAREYLVDLFRLCGAKEHTFDWHVMSHARLAGVEQAPWKPIAEVTDRDPAMLFLSDLRARKAGDGPWREALELAGPGEVGVRVTMLGGADTLLMAGTPPGLGESAVGTKLMASRRGTGALFAALHEPFRGGAGACKVETFERIAGDDDAMALRIVGREGSGIDDRVLVSLGDAAAKPVTLEGGGERFTFTGYAFIRIAADRVDASGDLAACRLRVAGTPKLFVNGKPADATVAGGVLEFKAK